MSFILKFDLQRKQTITCVPEENDKTKDTILILHNDIFPKQGEIRTSSGSILGPLKKPMSLGQFSRE